MIVYHVCACRIGAVPQAFFVLDDSYVDACPHPAPLHNVLKCTSDKKVQKKPKNLNQDLNTGRCRESFVCKWARANAERANPARIYMQIQLNIAGVWWQPH
jgi:hypothetical protein